MEKSGVQRGEREMSSRQDQARGRSLRSEIRTRKRDQTGGLVEKQGTVRRRVGGDKWQEHSLSMTPSLLQFSLLLLQCSTTSLNSPSNQLAILFPTHLLHGGPRFLEPGDRGGALPKPDVIVRAEHADWTGPSRGPPFWAGFQPEAGLARPRLALGRWLAVQLIACVQPNAENHNNIHI